MGVLVLVDDRRSVSMKSRTVERRRACSGDRSKSIAAEGSTGPTTAVRDRC